MHALRSAILLRRLLLAWYALVVSVAAASPLIYPKTIELVCSTIGGIQLVTYNDAGEPEDGNQHMLDCALCLAAAPPPTVPSVTPPAIQPLARALVPMVAATIAARIGAPLPARGPPQLLA